MTETLLSSKKASSYLKVSQATINKWADTGIINSFKTPGGHRRFLIEDLKNHHRFHSEGSSELTPTIYKTEIQNCIVRRDYKSISKYFEKYILKGNADNSYNLIFTLYMKNYSLEEIFDKIIKESMINIGKKWKRRSLGIEEEHIASNTVLTSLYRLDKVIKKKEHIGKTVICAGLENEFHEIGLLCVRIVLEASGWEVIYPGTNLPFNSIIKLTKKYKPDLLCISVTYMPDIDRITKSVKELEKLSVTQGFKILIGGENELFYGMKDHKCNCLSDLNFHIKEL
jgi:excisionase family DNA binding protein